MIDVKNNFLDNILIGKIYNFYKLNVPSYKWRIVNYMDHFGHYRCGNCSGYVGMLILDEYNDELTDAYLTAYPQLKDMVDTFLFQIQVFQVGAEFVFHDDGLPYIFGSAIFLTREWDMDFGGLFLYEDENKENKFVVPEYNRQVMNMRNDSGNLSRHAVSTITNQCEIPRVSIQVWGLKNGK